MRRPQKRIKFVPRFFMRVFIETNFFEGQKSNQFYKLMSIEEWT